MHAYGRFRALLSLLLAAAIWGACSTRAVAQAPARTGSPALVVLVRHGEKASDQGEDPALTPAGLQRARALATSLRHAGVTAIITTQLRRTRQTAQPLAAALGLTPEIVPVSVDWDQMDVHVKAVVAALYRHPGEVVLVVGHQNTVPPIIAALGGPDLPGICDPVFGNLYVLVPGARQAHLVQSHYGAPDPPGDCK